MRLIGQIRLAKQARCFCDFLQAQGIESQCDPDEQGYQVWVYDEAQLDQARTLLDNFLADPENPRYQQYQGLRDDFLLRQNKENELASRRQFNMRTQWQTSSMFKMGPVSLGLIALSILVALISSLGADKESLRWLFITDYQMDGNYLSWNPSLQEVSQGQVWRLFTPMFIHFGFMHILFNSMWVKDLGGIIETKHGSTYLLGLVLAFSALSNVAQFYMSGPLFGGMSGVVYGLLGFLWIRGKCDRTYGIILNKQVVTMMIVWFFICLTGLVGSVANTAHGAGALAGMAWGYLSAKIKR